MVRKLIVAALLMIPAVPAAADPTGVCGLEDSATTSVPCPPHVTYDEDGKEVGGASHSR